MRIAIFISSLKFGGAEKQAVIDAQLLARHHQVTFIAFRDGELNEQLPDSVAFIPLAKTNYFATARRMARLLRQLKIEVVHAHLFAPMVISSLASLLYKTAVVWNFHSHAYEDAGKGRWTHSLASKFPGVKSILFPAGELKAYYRMEHYTFPARKELVFFNSGQFFERQPLRTATTEKVVIGYVGRIIALKRVHLLIDLAREMKDEGFTHFEISIVGDGTALPEIKSQAKELDVLDLVRFHGFQPDTQKYYQDFSIFALPSREEVLSLSLIDAQLTGLPCVAFDVGGNIDIIEDGRSGYIVRDERAFLEKVKALTKDKELRQEMGNRAIEQSTNKFSQKARFENMINLYKSVV